MEQSLQRGDMYYANLGNGIGSEQNGNRPVVIIQNNLGNRFSSTIIVATISSRYGIKPRLPTHYFINAEDGLALPSIILLEQLRTIDKGRLTAYIGRLSQKHIEGIDHALAVSTGLIRPSSKKLIICLCASCTRHFFDSTLFYLTEIQTNARHLNPCICCKQRKGRLVKIERR